MKNIYYTEDEIKKCKNCQRRHVGFGFCPMVHMSMDGYLYELNTDDDYCSKFVPKNNTKNQVN